MKLPTVTVIMPIRNERDFIERSLGAVLAQDYPADRFDVIVADGQSTDGTVEIVRSLQKDHPKLQLIENPGRIVAVGLNLGIARAKSDVIVRVDGHCEIAPDYVRRCVEHLMRDGVDGVGGPLETIGVGEAAAVIARAMSSPFGVGGSAFRTRHGETGLVDTVAFPAYWRKTIDKAGPFDEELVRNQDDEYNYRLRKAGGKLLLAADVSCRYYSRSDFRSLWRQYFQYGSWKVRVLQKHPRQMKMRQFVPPLFVATILTSLAAALVSPLGRVVFSAVAGAYVLAVAAASLRTASRGGWHMLPSLPRAFATLHVAYGSGFLIGIGRFWNRWGAFYREQILPWHFTVRLTQYLLDGFVLFGAFAGAYLLRFEFQIPPKELALALAQLPVVVLIQLVVLSLAGVHRFIWRYVGMREARTILLGVLGAALPVLALRFALNEQFQALRVPLSVVVIDAMMAFIGVLGLRFARRVRFEYRERRSRVRPAAGTGSRALLVGAGRAGVLAAREIQTSHEMGLRVLGFVDDDPAKVGAEIQGFRVLGTTEHLPWLVREHNIEQVVITIARITRPEILRIIEICRRINVQIRVVPGLYEILQGKVQTTRLRIVDVENLLAREPVQLDDEQISGFLENKVVMITGAGGSIGTELSRQVARFKPARLLLVERAEAALFEIDQDVRRLFPSVTLVPIVADVGDENRVRSIFAEHRPQVVLHAAAHKHVPMMESHPEEAIRNNVLATRLLGETAASFGVEAFVLISTDKAVNPTSVMGASKRMAEIVVQDLAFRHRGRFLAVRFGNVIGSAGSVVPIFREQIRRGGPVTVTHPEMRRYFMTVREAAQLVLQAGAMGEGGEIFVLDMGEPIRILELAKAMITLTGLKPFEEMDIIFTGLRPGEKLFEELELSGEEIARTKHPKIFNGKLMGYAPERVEWALSRFTKLVRENDADSIRRFLNAFLPEAKLAVAPARPAAAAVLETPAPDRLPFIH